VPIDKKRKSKRKKGLNCFKKALKATKRNGFIDGNAVSGTKMFLRNGSRACN
jgi:hypothetical protein